MTELVIRQVKTNDLDQCVLIEAACYGPEGATRDRVKKRIDLFPQGFLIAEYGGQVVGFINSGATNLDDIGDETFKDMVGHEPTGRNVVIFSLAVQPEFQRQGFSIALMYSFIETAQRLNKEEILLLCKPDLIPYYEQYGFIHRGPSRSTHGGLQWQEMYLPLAKTT